MSRRRDNATGYARWMMKAATSGAAAFGELESDEDSSSAASATNHPKKSKSNNNETHSAKGEEDMEREVAKKSRLAPAKKNIHDDNDDEGRTIKGIYELDDEDDDIEKGNLLQASNEGLEVLILSLFF